jgi:hypothetical protein
MSKRENSSAGPIGPAGPISPTTEPKCKRESNKPFADIGDVSCVRELLDGIIESKIDR